MQLSNLTYHHIQKKNMNKTKWGLQHYDDTKLKKKKQKNIMTTPAHEPQNPLPSETTLLPQM